MVNVGPIGCIPSQRDANPAVGDKCVAFPNQLAELFNKKLQGLINEMNSNLNGSMFAFPQLQVYMSYRDNLFLKKVPIVYQNPTWLCYHQLNYNFHRCSLEDSQM